MAMGHDQKVSRNLTLLKPAQNEVFVAGEKYISTPLLTILKGIWLTSKYH